MNIRFELIKFIGNVFYYLFLFIFLYLLHNPLNDQNKKMKSKVEFVYQNY